VAKEITPFKTNPRLGIYEATINEEEGCIWISIAELSENGKPNKIYANLKISKESITVYANIDPPWKTVKNIVEVVDARERDDRD